MCTLTNKLRFLKYAGRESGRSTQIVLKELKLKKSLNCEKSPLQIKGTATAKKKNIMKMKSIFFEYRETEDLILGH